MRGHGTSFADSLVQRSCLDTDHAVGRERNRPMTQELVLGTLFLGMVGLLWVMTASLWTDPGQDTQGQTGDNAAGDSPSDRDDKHRRTIAA